MAWEGRRSSPHLCRVISYAAPCKCFNRRLLKRYKAVSDVRSFRQRHYRRTGATALPHTWGRPSLNSTFLRSQSELFRRDCRRMKGEQLCVLQDDKLMYRSMSQPLTILQLRLLADTTGATYQRLGSDLYGAFFAGLRTEDRENRNAIVQ